MTELILERLILLHCVLKLRDACVIGLHVLQGWSEREIFGKIRYMNEKGCRRKFKVDAYIENVNERLKKPA